MTMVLCVILVVREEIVATKRHERVEQKVLKTAFLRASDFQSMDTCNIERVEDYNVLEALYSPLVQYSTVDGQLYASAVKNYEISDEWLHFVLRNDIVTIDGYRITADDAAFSLKRLLLCNSNMHGKVAQFLDIGPISNINDQVDGIISNGQNLSLRIKGVPHLVLSFLSSIDFAIIPKISVDQKSLKIIEKRNTSGPYYLSPGDGANLFSLHAQKGHWALKSDSADVIHVLNANSASEIEELFIRNEIDFIGQSLEVLPEKKVELSKNVPQNRHSTLHTTDPLFVMSFVFTKKGMRIESSQRRELLTIIQGVYRRNRLPVVNQKGDFSIFHSSMLLDQSFGGLKGDYKNLSEKMREEAEHATSIKKKIRIGVHPAAVDAYRTAFSELSKQLEFDAMDLTKSHIEQRESKDFDLFQVSFDVSDREDTSLIAMSFHLGFFDQTIESDFMKNYISEPDDGKREVMLQRLHFKAVCDDPTLIPLSKMKMISVTQNGWHIPVSQKFVATPFFELRYRPD